VFKYKKERLKEQAIELICAGEFEEAIEVLGKLVELAALG